MEKKDRGHLYIGTDIIILFSNLGYLPICLYHVDPAHLSCPCPVYNKRWDTSSMSAESHSVGFIPVCCERLSEPCMFRDTVCICFYQCLCNGKSSSRH